MVARYHVLQVRLTQRVHEHAAGQLRSLHDADVRAVEVDCADAVAAVTGVAVVCGGGGGGAGVCHGQVVFVLVGIVV